MVAIVSIEFEYEFSFSILRLTAYVRHALNCFAAWEKDRNQKSGSVDWRFTTADARIKLRQLYSLIQTK